MICPRVLRLCGWGCEYRRVRQPRRASWGSHLLLLQAGFPGRKPEGRFVWRILWLLGCPFLGVRVLPAV